MYREIKKKKLILDNRKPYTRQITNYLAEVEIVDFAYTGLLLEGSPLTRLEVDRIYKGEFLIAARLDDHARIQTYKNLLQKMRYFSQRRHTVSEEVIEELYETLTGRHLRFRSNNPVIYEWAYNPPHPSEIKAMMSTLLHWIKTEEKGMTNYILRASELHNRLLKIYPFELENKEMARVLFYYYLMTKGYDIFPLDFSEQEYNETIEKYIKGGEIRYFCSKAEQALYQNLEMMLQVTAKN